jgi:ribosomal protein S27AE
MLSSNIEVLQRQLAARDAEIEGYKHELAAAKCCDSHKNVVDQLQAQIDVECEENKRLRENRCKQCGAHLPRSRCGRCHYVEPGSGPVWEPGE